MMVKIKYLGPRSRVIAGKHISTGEILEVNEKLVAGLRGDPEIEFLDSGPRTMDDGPSEAPVAPGEEETPEQTELPVASAKPEVVNEPKVARKPRGKKK